MPEEKKKGFFSKIFGGGQGCCCNLRIEEVPESDEKSKEEDSKSPGNAPEGQFPPSCCSGPGRQRAGK